MTTVPKTIAGRLQFFEQHLPTWAKDPVAIGLTAPELVSLANATAQARSDYDAVVNIRVTAQALTEAQHISVAEMYDIGSSFIKTIRAFAEKTNDPNVYVLAEIPAPQAPTPAGPPAKPTELEANLLLPFGIKLTWKGTVSQNASFGIYRKLPGESAFSFIETTREKSWEDTSLPAGVASVEYYIAAIRDSFQVNSNGIGLQFGPDGVSTTALSMAA